MKMKPDKIFTVCLVCKDGKVLLAKRRPHKGATLKDEYLNGYGGKVGKGKESAIMEEAKRELKEESGLIALEMEKTGLLAFKFLKEKVLYYCYFFRVNKAKGRLRATKEMEMGKWYPMTKNGIPLRQMWEGDKFWVPYFLAEKKFAGCIVYNNKIEINVVSHFITEYRALV